MSVTRRTVLTTTTALGVAAMTTSPAHASGRTYRTDSSPFREVLVHLLGTTISFDTISGMEDVTGLLVDVGHDHFTINYQDDRGVRTYRMGAVESLAR